MSLVAAVAGVLPEFRYPQETITEAFADLVLGPEDPDRPGPRQVMRRVHANCGVRSRHLALPIGDYPAMADFSAANDRYLRAAETLGAQAVQKALSKAGVRADQVDLIATTTVTGVAVPSLEARLAGPLGLRPDVKRLPLFGLGCAGGAGGLARVHDYLVGHPDDVAVLLAVELCSLTVQRGDRSMANVICSGLFGDGAAAVVLMGENRAADHRRDHPHQATARVVDSRSHLYPDTGRTMGWDVGTTGLQVVLGAEVPTLVTRYLGGDVKSFLHEHGLDVTDVTAWVSHPGGPKVIDAVEAELANAGVELGRPPLSITRQSLSAIGNLSSVSVLFVLADTLESGHGSAGTPGVLLAMGPGFASELVLLEW